MAGKKKNRVREIYDSFWKSIVETKKGTLSKRAVMHELADFHFVIHQVPKVYCHITGNVMSKIMYEANTVIECADNYAKKNALENLDDFLKDMTTKGVINMPQYNALKIKAKNYF